MLLANLYIQIVMGSLLFFTSLIMIFLILIQRGRGGGLAGALGGSGGSSAFGAKAGDTFTRVTAGMAIFWFVLCLLSILMIQGRRVAPITDPVPTAGASAPVPANNSAPIVDPLKDLPPLPLEKSNDAEKSGETGKGATEPVTPPSDDATKTPTETGALPEAGTATGDAGTTTGDAGGKSTGETGGAAGAQDIPKTDGSGL